MQKLQQQQQTNNLMHYFLLFLCFLADSSVLVSARQQSELQTVFGETECICWCPKMAIASTEFS